MATIAVKWAGHWHEIGPSALRDTLFDGTSHYADSCSLSPSVWDNVRYGLFT
jgi:hypothetical protein